MTNNAFQFLVLFLGQIFRLFTSWYIPGTNVTPAGVLFFIAFAGLSIRFVKALFLNYVSSEVSQNRFDQRSTHAK